MEIIYRAQKISDDNAEKYWICDGGESWKIKHQHKHKKPT